MNSTPVTNFATSKTAAVVPLQSLGQLILRDSQGRKLQAWDITQSKLTIGSGNSASIRCYLPGVAEHHALLVIGGKQIFLRALSHGVTRNGTAIAEFIMDSSEPSISFEIAGHTFEFLRHQLVRTEQVANEVTDVVQPEIEKLDSATADANPPGRLQFTLVRAIEKQKKSESAFPVPSQASIAIPSVAPAVVEDRSASKSQSTTILAPMDSDPTARPAWLDQILLEAVGPLQKRIEALAEPIENVQRAIEKRRSRRAKAKPALALPVSTPSIPAAPVSMAADPEFEKWIDNQRLLQQSVNSQATKLELVNERVTDILSQISTLERIVTSENRDQENRTVASRELEAEVLKLQQDTLTILRSLGEKQSADEAQSTTGVAWRNQIHDSLVSLQNKVDSLTQQHATYEQRVANLDELVANQKSEFLGIEKRLTESLEQLPAKLLAELPKAQMVAPLAREVTPTPVSEMGSLNFLGQVPSTSQTADGPAMFGMVDGSIANDSRMGPSIDLSSNEPFSSIPSGFGALDRASANPIREDSDGEMVESSNSSFPAASEWYSSNASQAPEYDVMGQSSIDGAVTQSGFASQEESSWPQPTSESQASWAAEGFPTVGSRQPGSNESYGIEENASWNKESADLNAQQEFRSGQLPSWWSDESDTPAMQARPESSQDSRSEITNADSGYFGHRGQTPESQNLNEFSPAVSNDESVGFGSDSLASDYSHTDIGSSNIDHYGSNVESSSDDRSLGYAPSISGYESSNAAGHGGFESSYANESEESYARFTSNDSQNTAQPSHYDGIVPDVSYDSPDGSRDSLGSGLGQYNSSEYRQSYETPTYETSNFSEPDQSLKNESYTSFDAESSELSSPTSSEDDDGGLSSAALMERLRKQLEESQAEEKSSPADRDRPAIGSYNDYSPLDARNAETESHSPSSALLRGVGSVPGSSMMGSSMMDSSLSSDRAQTPASKPTAGSEENEESVEEYMRRLLARMRGVSESEIPSVPAPVQASAPIAPSRVEPRPESTPDVRALRRERQTEDDEEASENISESWTAPFDPGSYVPKISAPEKARDLNAMRELANTSARSAIQVSARRRHSTALLMKMTIASVGFGAGASLIVINGVRLNIAFVATIAAFLVGLIWGYDAIATFSPLVKNSRSGKELRKQSANRDAESAETEPIAEKLSSGK